MMMMPLFFQSRKKYRYFFVMQSQIQCASFSKMTQMKLEIFLSWKLNVAKGIAVLTFKFLEKSRKCSLTEKAAVQTFGKLLEDCMGCVRLGTSSQDPKVPIGPKVH